MPGIVGINRLGSGLLQAYYPGTFYGQLANRCCIPTATTDAQTYAIRTFHFARTSMTKFKVNFAGGWVCAAGQFSATAEANSGGTTTIKASIEYPQGTFTQLLFSGSSTGTIASGADGWCDLVTLSIPNGAKFWVHQSVHNTAGMPYSLGTNGNRPFVSGSTGDAMQQTATDLTMVGGEVDGFSGAQIIYPMAIVGPTASPSVCIWGDSRQSGNGDTTTDATGDTGELGRLLGGTYPYIKCGTSSDEAFAFQGGGHTKRVALANYCTHVICGYGINDLNGTSNTAAQLEGWINTIAALPSPRNFYQATLPPVDTSSDGFATVGNQTPFANDPNRLTFNTWARGIPSGVAGCIDGAPSSKWNVSPSAYQDGGGLHESTFGNQQIATVLGVPSLTVSASVAAVMPQS